MIEEKGDCIGELYEIKNIIEEIYNDFGIMKAKAEKQNELVINKSNDIASQKTTIG